MCASDGGATTHCYVCYESSKTKVPSGPSGPQVPTRQTDPFSGLTLPSGPGTWRNLIKRTELRSGDFFGPIRVFSGRRGLRTKVFDACGGVACADEAVPEGR